MNRELQPPAVHMVRTGPRGEAPIILVHPVGLDLTYWGGQIEALHGVRDVIAYDLPGNGSTPGTPADWTFDATTATLARVMASTGEDRINVVGISIGGMIAQAFALAHPEAMQSLVLIGTAANFADDEREAARQRAATARRDGMAGVVQTTLERWFTPATMAHRPDIVDRVGKTMLADDPAIYAAMWDMIAELNFADRLGEIVCPTLIMTGETDPICPPEVAQAIHGGISTSRLAIVPQAAHMCILENPDFVNDRLAEFLGKQATIFVADGCDD